MIRRNERLTGVGVAVLAVGVVALQGCSSGSGGSQVGNKRWFTSGGNCNTNRIGT